MFSTTLTSRVLFVAALSLASAQAMAVEASADFKANGCSLPTYKDSSAKAEEQGLVKLVYEVGSDGKVLDAKIESSSGYTALDQASLRAVKECSFKVDSSVAKDAKVPAKIAFDWVLN
jgi:protein TonB